MDTPNTPNLNDFFAYIDEHTQILLARMIDYLRRPSVSAGESNHASNENLEIAHFFMGIKTGVAMLSCWIYIH
jgi:hypothetical protein